jgi:hypothetical protein
MISCQDDAALQYINGNRVRIPGIETIYSKIGSQRRGGLESLKSYPPETIAALYPLLKVMVTYSPYCCETAKAHRKL